MKRVRFLGIILLVIPLQVFAKGEDYRFKRITTDDGLSKNNVFAIVQDTMGFMWFATDYGLNRYDGYEFKQYLHSENDSFSLANNYVNGLLTDKEGNLWVSTNGYLHLYRPDSDDFERIPLFKKKIEYQGIQLMSLIVDKENNIWLGNSNLGLFRYLVKEKKIIDYSRKVGNLGIGSIVQTGDGMIWVGTDLGKLFRIDVKKQTVKEFNNPLVDADQLHDDYVWFIIEQNNDNKLLTGSTKGLFDFDRKTGTFALHPLKGVHVEDYSFTCYFKDTLGAVWYGTSGNGLMKVNDEIIQFVREPNNIMSISNNEINDIYRDRTGVLWVATRGGINKLDPALSFFTYYQNDPNDPTSLITNNISSFCEDKNHNVWIGTQGGGVNVFFPATKKFYPLKKITGFVPQQLDKVIYDLCASSDGNIWIATRNALDRYDQLSGKFYHYSYRKYNPDFLSENNYSLDGKAILSLAEGRDGEVWLGTYGGGIARVKVDGKTKKAYFIHFSNKPGDVNSLSNNYIRKVLVDRFGIVWIGTLGSGLDRYDPETGKFSHFLHDPDNPSGLSNNFVTEIYEDHFGNLWVGTYKGLNKFDREQETFTAFQIREGEPYRMISEIFLDKNSNLWITTDNGLYRYNLKSRRVNRYGTSNGLQGNNFNINALYHASDGSLFIGGRNGFNIFRPDKFRINTSAPPVVITEISINNKPVKIGYEKGRLVIHYNGANEHEIFLSYKDKIISFKFAALSYSMNDQYQYAYMMEGLNDKWIDSGSKMRVAAFTNLYPGKYVFHVKAANNDGIWSETDTAVNLFMAVPYWKTWWAILFYISIILSIFYLILRFVLIKKRLENELYAEHIEREKVMEINKMKIEFFSNISHEFRTPLTLIISPVENLMKKTKNPEVSKKLRLIHHNAIRLLNLVNQLLNLRKAETDNWKMNTEPIDLIEFVEEIKTSFNELAAKKQITFRLELQLPRPLILWFDRMKMKSVFYNLLSNAFKYTPDGKKITIVIRKETEVNEKKIFQRKINNEENGFAVVDVIDEGIGISKDKIGYIFNRFYTIDSRSATTTSTGIGLSLVKDIMIMHHGKVTVTSNPGSGSCFSVFIPMGDVNKNEEYMERKPDKESGEQKTGETGAEELKVYGEKDEKEREKDEGNEVKNKPVLLIIEDDEDIRQYIIEELSHSYTFREASNGLEGLTIAREELPDLIISDLIMPEMDGNEMVSLLKKDIATSHIPVIMLTAKSAQEDIVDGLKTGADAYITKPFSVDVLKAGIDNLLTSRARLREKFSKELMLKPEEIVINDRDGELLAKLIRIIEENMSNPDFSVKTLADGVGLSRMQLYRKIKAILDKTPHELINTLRLERAAQILVQNQLNVSEVAYMTGFNTPKYFSRCFREKFGVLPTQYVKSKTREDLRKKKNGN